MSKWSQNVSCVKFINIVVDSGDEMRYANSSLHKHATFRSTWEIRKSIPNFQRDFTTVVYELVVFMIQKNCSVCICCECCKLLFTVESSRMFKQKVYTTISHTQLLPAAAPVASHMNKE